MSRLHVFDMDGTLLYGAASVEVSRYLGCFEQARAIEMAWQAGELEDLEFWDSMLPMWAHASPHDIDEAFASARWLQGIREVFTDIHDRGERLVIISQSPHFFVRRLEGWGADWTFGSKVQPGVKTTREMMLTVNQKVDITLFLLGVLGIGEPDCVAYGDSSSDVALFDRLGHTVGVNPNTTLRHRAALIYDGGDLREAYAMGRSLLDPRTEAEQPT